MRARLKQVLQSLRPTLRRGFKQTAAQAQIPPTEPSFEPGTGPDSAIAPAATRFLLGGMGESRHLYALDEHWCATSHRTLDVSALKLISHGSVISADPELDLARRIDHTVSERVQLAEFAADTGEPLMSVKTRARSGLAGLLTLKANSQGADEDGESLGAVQAIQERGWLLCTPTNRFADLAVPVQVMPVTFTLLKLLEAHSRKPDAAMDQASTVVCLVFPGPERTQRMGDFKIVCLATFTAAGHLEGLDFVPGSGITVEQIISNYVSVRRLNSEGIWPKERLALATSNDAQVKKWLSASQPYPRQKLIFGVPVQKAANLAGHLSLACLGATVTYSAWAHMELSRLKADIAHTQVTQQQARAKAIAHVREHSLGYVLTLTGLDSQRAIDLAVQAWRPGALVEMKATSDRVSLTASTSLGQGHAQHSGAEDGVHNAALLDADPPQGCTRAPAQVNAAMNELVITYECTLQNAGLERLRAAGL